MEIVRDALGQGIAGIKYASLKTLTGLTLDQAIGIMKAKLPPTAYKPVPDMPYLTDINPAYLTEVATNVFGMCGIGWHYRFDAPVVTEFVQKTRSGERGMFRADLDYFYLVVTVQTEDGNLIESEPIYVNGSNDSEDRGYAVRGAITNALGAAFSKLCWQLPLYQGLYDNKKGEFKETKSASMSLVVIDPNLPWWEKAWLYIKTDPATAAAPLGKSEAGKRAIEMLKLKIGSADDAWWNAEAHLEKALKAYVGKDNLAVLSWIDFRKLTRIYGGPQALAGDQVKDVLFQHYLKPTEWQNVILSIPLENDMVLTDEMAEAFNASIPVAAQYLKDKKFDYESMAAALRQFCLKIAEPVPGPTTPELVEAVEAQEEIIY